MAFEPVGSTFSLLASNVSCFRYDNVSLFNTAVSDKFACAKMIIPAFSTGMPNYYEAKLAGNTNEGVSVLTLSLDGMMIEKKIALIKIDAEGHEIFALSGMRQLIKRWNPVLIVEASSNDAAKYLLELGYTSKKLLGSPNEIFQQN